MKRLLHWALILDAALIYCVVTAARSISYLYLSLREATCPCVLLVNNLLKKFTFPRAHVDLCACIHSSSTEVRSTENLVIPI